MAQPIAVVTENSLQQPEACAGGQGLKNTDLCVPSTHGEGRAQDRPNYGSSSVTYSPVCCSEAVERHRQKCQCRPRQVHFNGLHINAGHSPADGRAGLGRGVLRPLLSMRLPADT